MTSLNALIEAAKLVEYDEDGTPKTSSKKTFPELVSMDVKVISCDGSKNSKNPENKDLVHVVLDPYKIKVKSPRSLRETHNKLEKNRRAELKNYFFKLKSCLPRLVDKKASNVAILTEATKHIKDLHEQDKEFEVQRARLRKCRMCLDERIRMLKDEMRRQDLQNQLFAQVENEKKKVDSSDDITDNCSSEVNHRHVNRNKRPKEMKTVEVQANEEDIFEQMNRTTENDKTVKLKLHKEKDKDNNEEEEEEEEEELIFPDEKPYNSDVQMLTDVACSSLQADLTEHEDDETTVKACKRKKVFNIEHDSDNELQLILDED